MRKFVMKLKKILVNTQRVYMIRRGKGLFEFLVNQEERRIHGKIIHFSIFMKTNQQQLMLPNFDITKGLFQALLVVAVFTARIEFLICQI